MLWALLSGIGVALLVAGWIQVRTESVYAEQVAGINMAIVGVIAIGAGAIPMLLAGRRAVGVRRLALLGDLRGMPVRSSAGASAGSISQNLVGGEGLRHFHRAGCTMAQGRNWSAASRQEHERAGRVACGVCRP
ncbi:MAG TPA: hypothetical protein VKI19_05235 [Acidimicrobiales bacterium]|jgi:hypothetical protein|nr:hypothetical protein [Acidimicrobiales bacterium]